MRAVRSDPVGHEAWQKAGDPGLLFAYWVDWKMWDLLGSFEFFKRLSLLLRSEWHESG